MPAGRWSADQTPGSRSAGPAPAGPPAWTGSGSGFARRWSRCRPPGGPCPPTGPTAPASAHRWWRAGGRASAGLPGPGWPWPAPPRGGWPLRPGVRWRPGCLAARCPRCWPAGCRRQRLRGEIPAAALPAGCPAARCAAPALPPGPAGARRSGAGPGPVSAGHAASRHAGGRARRGGTAWGCVHPAGAQPPAARGGSAPTAGPAWPRRPHRPPTCRTTGPAP